MKGQYIQTPIGKIPEEWQIVRLCDEGICEIRGSTQKNIAEDIPFIPMELISDYKIFAEYEMRKQKDVKSYTYCEAGDLLLAKITPSLENGKQGIVPLNIPSGFALATTEVFPIFCKGIEKLFLFYILKYPKFRKVLEHSMTGTTGRQRVSKRSVKRLRIPLPPIEEQKRIAEVLSCVDDAIQKVDEAFAKTIRLKKGLMRKLLTVGIGHKEFKHTKIGYIPKDWRLSNLLYCADIRYGLGQPTERDPEGVPMIRATNIKAGKIVESDLVRLKKSKIPNNKKPFLKEGEIIVVRSGFYTGDIARITKQWNGSVAGYDLVVTPHKNINSSFLTYWLLSSQIQKKYFYSQKTRSAQPHLNAHQLSRTPIPLPPIGEQKKIADILSTLDEKLELDSKRKEKLERIKQGLMNDLLTGKRRVKVAM